MNPNEHRGMRDGLAAVIEFAERTLASTADDSDIYGVSQRFWKSLALTNAQAVIELSKDRADYSILRPLAQALSDRIIEVADNNFVLERGSREAIVALRAQLTERMDDGTDKS